MDVCRALSMDVSGGSTRYLMNLNQDEVARHRPTDGPKGGRPNAIITESGLYKLIMRSDKPQARPFQDWVTREVLPSIRKTGAYELPAAPAALKGEVMPLPVDFAEAATLASHRRLRSRDALLAIGGRMGGDHCRRPHGGYEDAEPRASANADHHQNESIPSL
ncbi:MAG: hypothetical protein LWW93_16695 [Hyphomicrobiales bacterium]|nr:hypothetical protein [Hyphomicrobiales bacterium]